MVTVNYQFDKIYSHLRDKSLATLVKDYLLLAFGHICGGLF